jgi:hypothetical protein
MLIPTNKHNLYPTHNIPPENRYPLMKQSNKTSIKANHHKNLSHPPDNKHTKQANPKNPKEKKANHLNQSKY